MVDYNKPLKMRCEVEGVDTEFERELAGHILLKVYNLACDVVNNGGIERFNSKWNQEHPDWVNDGDPDNEYNLTYMKYFKNIADEISDKVRASNGVTYKLCEYENCLINFDEGYFTIYGYKETL